jgi:AcrR family transcriptional regulator
VTPGSAAQTGPSVQKSPLTVDAIVRAALEIADVDGLSAVTMRAVGARLGVAAMSLYRHVANKEALLELMADDVLSGLPVPDPDRPWQDEMVDFWMAVRALLLRHPAVAQLMLELPVIGPEISLRGEGVLACLLAGGLPDDLAAQALTAMTWYTVGGSLHAISSRRADDDPGVIGLGVRLADLAPERYPSVRRVAHHIARDATDEHFLSGLTRLVSSYGRS